VLAYHRGYASYYVGFTRSQNPFDSYTSSVDYDRWECGWLDAYDDQQAAIEQCSRDHQVE
jgi:ribosome modulation factor